MKIFWLILSIIIVVSYSLNHMTYNIKYNGNMAGNKTQMIVGSVLSAITTGICWWYVIDYIIDWW